jgi:hypothetical protein
MGGRPKRFFLLNMNEEELFELDELEQQKVIQSRSKNTMTSQHIQKTLERVTINQRKPDTTQDESSYQTTFWDKHGIPIACGFGSTQVGADTDATNKLLSQALTEQHKMDVQSFREKIEGMKKEKYPGDTDASPNKTIRALGRRLDDCIKVYNKAIDDLLASLDETEK